METKPAITPRQIAVLLILIGVATLVFVVYVLFSRVGKNEVEISVVPIDSIVTIGDQTLQDGTHYLTPGRYNTTTEREGFKTDVRPIEITPETDRIAFAIRPKNKLGEDYLKDNPDEDLRYEAAGGIDSQSEGKARTEAFPVLKKLPFISPDKQYAIDYGTTPDLDNGAFVLIGNSSTRGRAEAVAWLKDNSVDISNFDIRYDDYVSPLTDRKTSERGY